MRLAMLTAACVLGVGLAPGHTYARSNDPAEHAYISAGAMLRRGMYDLAAPEYQRFLDSNPQGERAAIARYGLAVCLFRLDKASEAAAQLEAIGEESFEFAADALLLRAHCALAVADYPEAERACGRLLADHPQHAAADDAAALRCEALFRMEAPADAIAAAADQLAAQWPHSDVRARAELFTGVASARAGDHDAAVRRFDRIIQSAPEADLAPRAGLLLAQSLEALGQWPRAHEHYLEAAESSDPSLVPDALLGLARSDLQAGRSTSALDRVRTILEDFPDAPVAFHAAILLARTQCAAGRPAEAQAALAAFDSERPFPADLADDADFWRARSSLVSGQYDEAARLLEHALSLHPQSELRPQMQFDLAVAHARLERHDRARRAFEAFLLANPNHELTPRAELALAGAAQQRGDYEQAVNFSRGMLERHADHENAPDAALVLAECCYQLEQFEECVQACTAAIPTATSEIRDRLTYRMGMAQLRQDKSDEARSTLRDIISGPATPNEFLPAIHAVGAADFAEGEWGAAEQRMTQYLAAHPDGSAPLAADALLRQGIARQRLGREESALEAFHRLIRDHPESPHAPHAMFERAQSLLALDRVEEAREAFEAVSRDAADSRFAAPARERLGALAEAAGDFALAAQWYERAGPGGAAEFDKGRALLAASDWSGAREALSRAIDDAPDHPRAPSARAQRAIAMARLGRADDAMAEIDRLFKADAPPLEPALARSLRYEQAWILRDQGDATAARASFAQLLADPSQDALRAHALVELGALQSDAEEWSEAADSLEEGRRLAATTPGVGSDLAATATYRLAVCALRQGHHDRVTALLDTFASEFPGSSLIPSAHLFCAEALTHLGRHARAAERLERAMADSQAPDILRPALLRLGEAHASLSDWAASAAAFSTWLEQFDSDPLWFQARFGLARALENQQRGDEAIGQYRQIVAGHDGETAARAQFQIGEILFAQGDHEGAVREFMVVDSVFAYPQWSAAALFEAGRCLEEMGRTADALARFQEVQDRYAGTQWASLAGARLAELRLAEADASTTGETQ